jgi:hypothetical protein
MRQTVIKTTFFWFVLLILAIINALIRETTYKPLLNPYLGIWAHQLSSVTGIVLFYIAINFFLKRNQNKYSRKTLVIIGTYWIFLTLIFETGMNLFIRHLTIEQVLETYYFWKGETWIFVLLSLIISPLIAAKSLKHHS